MGEDFDLDTVARVAAREREVAHAELRAGQKRGHWVWWVFPTLAVRGGDMFSAQQSPVADLLGVQHVEAYARHPELRVQLIQSFRTASAAFAAAEGDGGQAPYRVLDAGFGRYADGEWLRGPVDSFKAFCSATAFAATAHAIGDAELKHAALQLLAHFRGDVVYTAGGKGTSGYVARAERRRNVLVGHDVLTLELVGGDWDKIVSPIS